MAGEPQTDIQLNTVNLEWTASQTNTIPILACPDGANFQLQLLSIHTVIGDSHVAGGTLSLRYGTTDDSNSQNETLLGAGTVNPETGGDLGSTDFLSVLFDRSSVILDPGDTVYAVCIAGAGGITFQNDLSAVVEFRVLRHS
jgi:hypothetical protein